MKIEALSDAARIRLLFLDTSEGPGGARELYFKIMAER